MDICIPTLRARPEIEQQIQDIRRTAPGHRILTSCQDVSSSMNRNLCLEGATSDPIIMVDDDISGFFPTWVDRLVEPLSDPRVCMVSARLMNPNGTMGRNCTGNMQESPRWIQIIPKRYGVLCMACVAFRNLGLRFDEGFVGSGFEDADVCFQYLDLDRRNKFIINNDCKLVHLNEQKNQWGGNFDKNHSYFIAKWLSGGR